MMLTNETTSDIVLAHRLDWERNVKLTTITVRIWKRVLEKLDGKLEAACLRRDAYLARIIEIELDHLRSEIPCPNSEVGGRFIVSQLDSLDRKPISIKLPLKQVQELDQLCFERRIPRDAFFNRLLYLLAAPNTAVARLFFGIDAGDWTKWLLKKYSAAEYLRTEQDRIFYPLTPYINPFGEIREGLALYEEDETLVDTVHQETKQNVKMVEDGKNLRLPQRLYTVVFDDKQFPEVNLYGFNCYLPEWMVPGHPDAIARAKSLDELHSLAL